MNCLFTKLCVWICLSSFFFFLFLVLLLTVHPKAPQDVTLKIIGATKANMTWKVHSHGNNYTLLCQVKLQYGGEVIHVRTFVHFLF